MTPAWQYSSGAFTPYDLGDTGHDFDAWLSSQGWIHTGVIPDSSERPGYGTIDAELFRHQETMAFFVQITHSEIVIAYFICPSSLDFLLFLRDFLFPLAAGVNRDSLRESVTEAGKFLFDRQYGLQCARDVRKREDAEERERLRLSDNS